MPKIVDHEKRRANIVESSTNLIAEQGFDQLTIRGLADTLGISTGMITYYFASKDEILFAALKGIHDRFFERISDAVAEKTGLEAIRTRMQISLPLSQEIKREWSVMFQFWGRATHNPEFSEYMKEQHTLLQKHDIKHISAAQKNGVICSSLKPANIFEQLDAITTGMGITCVFNPERLSRKSAYTIIDEALARLAPSR